MVNRLRDVLSGYFPALERAFDYAHSHGALTLLTGYQTPQAIHRIGESRLRAWLVKRKVRSADQIAAAVLAAAKAQQTVVPGQDVAAMSPSPHGSRPPRGEWPVDRRIRAGPHRRPRGACPIWGIDAAWERPLGRCTSPVICAERVQGPTSEGYDDVSIRLGM